MRVKTSRQRETVGGQEKARERVTKVDYHSGRGPLMPKKWVRKSGLKKKDKQHTSCNDMETNSSTGRENEDETRPKRI